MQQSGDADNGEKTPKWAGEQEYFSWGSEADRAVKLTPSGLSPIVKRNEEMPVGKKCRDLKQRIN